MSENTPDYHKGDVITPNEGSGMGRALFIADHEPRQMGTPAAPEYQRSASGWFYGNADALKYRKATSADAAKQRDDINEELQRVLQRFAVLAVCEAKMREEDARER
jgi:hypothetical protein